MRCLGIDEQLGAIAGDFPARGHEKRVVDEMVVGTDAEQCGWHPAQVCVEGRDIGVAALLLGHSGQEEIDWEAGVVEDVGSRLDPHATLTGCARQIVRTEHQIRGHEPMRGAMVIPHAQ